MALLLVAGLGESVGGLRTSSGTFDQSPGQRSGMLRQQLQVRQTIETCEKAVRENRESAEAHYRLGEAYCLTWHLRTEAEAAFKEALRLRPNYPEAYNRLGWIYLNTGEPVLGLVRYGDEIEGCEKAIAHFRAAIAIKADYTEAYVGLGVAYQVLGRNTEACDFYQQAITLNRNDSAAYDGLSKAYGLLGRFEEAVEALNYKIRISHSESVERKDEGLQIGLLPHGNEDRFIDQIEVGRLYAKMGRYQEAVDAYKLAIRLKPTDAMGYHGLGLTNAQFGDRESALAQYRILMDMSRHSLKSFRDGPDAEYQHFAEDLLHRLENGSLTY